jgi:putative CocE/NonD family hydrolase
LVEATAVLPLGQADLAAVGQRVPAYQDWLEHSEPGDPWWDPIDFSRDLVRVPPASFVGGWYDLFLAAQVADYVALRRQGRPARLTIGPWTHSSPGLVGATVRDGLSWFDAQLDPAPVESVDAPVRLYVMGADRWVEFSLWPPAGAVQHWYLGRSHTLTSIPPSESAPDRFVYDPGDPTPAVGGASLNAFTAGPKNQRAREERNDVLVYTSPVLTEDLSVIGPLTATLFVRSSLDHTDFVARLCDVDQRGRSTNLSDGIMRLTPASMTRDERGVCRLEIAMWPTANCFKRGHRMRLQVSSGAHPLFARNTGTGEPMVSGSALRPAAQEVLHEAAYPSSIALNVVTLFG